MKKIASLIITAALFCTAFFAKEKLFSFSLGLSSGFPIYGEKSVLSNGSEIYKGNHVIIGGTGTVNLNLTKQISFYLGNDTLWDITWNNSEKSSKVHISFPLGIKIYPGLGGLNLGLAYTLGFRADNINTNTIKDYNEISPWGNGFKVQIEYNFAHNGKSQYYPSLGGYWNLMPRGNKSWDNLIVLYIAANF